MRVLGLCAAVSLAFAIGGCGGGSTSAPAEYTVTFITDGTTDAELIGNLSQVVLSGGSATQVEAVPPTNYEFVDWTRGGALFSTNNPLTVTNVRSNLTIVANFSIAAHDVTFVAGAGGQVQRDGQPAGATVVLSVLHGSNSAAVTAVPAASHDFVNWTYDDAVGAVFSTEATITVDNVMEDVTLHANFASKTYTVTFNAGANGQVHKDGEAAPAASVEVVVDHGADTPEVAAVPASGYFLANWTIDVAGGTVYSTDTHLVVTNVTEDITLVANFAVEATLTMEMGLGAGAITPDVGTHSVPGGAPFPISAVPAGNNGFLSWEVTLGTATIADEESPSTTVTVTGAATVRANFVSGIVFVDASATGEDNGSSWADAYTSLQTAITATSSGQIWVAAGTYYPTTDPLNRDAFFGLKNNVAIYGGFTNAILTRAKRDWVANETILSGDINQSGDHEGNSHGLVRSAAAVTGTSLLDGFTITMAHSESGNGAGMRNSGTPNVRNCLFSRNRSTNQGGAMRNDAAPIFDNCVFYRNSSFHQGGAIFNYRTSPTFIDCLFIYNVSTNSFGGGVYNDGSHPTVINTVFVGNICGNPDTDARGGAFASQVNSEPVLINCLFFANASTHGGGAIMSRDSTPTIVNCTITGNLASLRTNAHAGGIHNWTSTPVIINSIVWGNRSAWNPEMDTATQPNNHIGGANPLFENAPVRVDRTNAAGTETTVFVTSASTNYAADDIVVIDFDGVARTVTGVDDTEITFSPALSAASTIYAHVSKWADDSNLTPSFRLQSGSICIDTGTNAPFEVGGDAEDVATDLDGNPRIMGSFVDIGAYEYQPD